MAAAELWYVRQRQLEAEAELYLADVASRLDIAAEYLQYTVMSGDVGQSLLTLIQPETFDLLRWPPETGATRCVGVRQRRRLSGTACAHTGAASAPA